MTTPKETCPKCGSEVNRNYIIEFCCGTNREGRYQSYRCRITELEKEVERLREALSLVLPMAKGYAHRNPVGSNQKYCDIATALLDKGGKTE
jgi:hypothetical protein